MTVAIVQGALELGVIYALVAMALFLSYSILDIADLTTDSGFVLGAAVSVTVAAAGHPSLAILAAMAAGSCAGFVTAFLQYFFHWNNYCHTIYLYFHQLMLSMEKLSPDQVFLKAQYRNVRQSFLAICANVRLFGGTISTKI